MNLIEITYSQGALEPEQRGKIATAVIDNLLRAPDAPESALERAAQTTHVWFREGLSWKVGSGDRPAVVATITIPAAWRGELSAHAIDAVRRSLARHAPGIDLGDEAALWINVIGIEDGSIGMGGTPSSASDIVRFLTQDVEPSVPDDLPDGVLIDPICGMKVRLGSDAVTLEHDGCTVAFCATGCRDVYAADNGIDLSW